LNIPHILLTEVTNGTVTDTGTDGMQTQISICCCRLLPVTRHVLL